MIVYITIPRLVGPVFSLLPLSSLCRITFLSRFPYFSISAFSAPQCFGTAFPSHTINHQSSNMRIFAVAALAALATAQSTTSATSSASGSLTTSTTSAAPSCAAGQSTCNGVCFDSSEFTCCPAGLCASGSYCGQDSSGNDACCAQNTQGSCSAASSAVSLSRGATASSGAASATASSSSSASGSKSSGASSSASASSSQSSGAATSSSTGAAAGHADSWLSNAVTYAVGGLLAALI